MQRFRHLMVGLSCTESDVGLIQYAAMVARLGTAKEVRFVHVLPPASTGPERLVAQIEEWVRVHFVGVPETVRVSWEVVAGPLHDRLLEYTADRAIDLLLVGHDRNTAGRQALARRLAMKAPCSTWMVPQGSAALLNRILVPIDFSDHSADTMRVATSMACLKGDAECLALHVYFNEARVTYEEYDQVLRGEEERAYQQFIAAIDCQGAVVTSLFEEGANIAHVIDRVAERERVDLIVMATRGRSRSASILLGSVTEETIIDTRLPLLIVKHFGARMGLLEALLDRSFQQRRNPQFD